MLRKSRLKVNVIIPAAGSGERLKAATCGVPKQFVSIDGMPMVYHSLRAFGAIPSVRKIIVATTPDYFDWFDRAQLKRFGITTPVTVTEGGVERVDSVSNALEHIDANVHLVAVHDAARPYIHTDDILRVFNAALKKGAALLVRSVVPTVKRVNTRGIVVQTIDRTTLKHAETPQVFRTPVMLKAYKAYRTGSVKGRVTDDAYLAESIGQRVVCVEAHHPNEKVTHPHDLRTEETKGTAMNIKIGMGYDIHRLLQGEKLFIGGVEIPFTKGCLGHSDGDPLLHAIIDALLGTVGTKDIGQYFPNTNARLRKISSVELLRRTKKIIDRFGCSIINIDATVICEKPRLADFKEDMVATIAGVLTIRPDQVAIKAKTKEGLDAEGASNAVSAHAVVLVEFPETKTKPKRAREAQS